ncbi:hypothetical protein ABPG72_022211 [Tetrahymena utriculariae]
MSEQKTLEDKVAFDPSEWEEVPFYEITQLRKHSDVISLDNQDSSQKQSKQMQSVEESQSEQEKQTRATNLVQSATVARQLQNQYFLLEQGKKYQKYKKYIKFEQFFRDNYEKSLYFDPEQEIFITSDGLQMAASSGNQIGTSLLYNKQTKELVGFSNISYNIEISTVNKALEQAIQEEEEENGQQNDGSKQENMACQNQQSAQKNGGNNSSRPENTLESIYDWIEKKDKLKQKRIKKQNKSKETLSQYIQDSQSYQKNKRNPSMNKFIRKMKK